ncbi:MAG: F-type H+-transporting ATPase subunit delta [Chloroflexota bacterium]|jgi:ATP synthase F1 delta subunit|nr:F-type H+-transporting ATPase subunit delta [Chloroflexota bacterium]
MEEIATVYARSLFEVAREHDKLDVVREQLGQVADAVAEERSLTTFFFSPYFSTEEKKDGLHKAVTDGDPIVVNFLELLVEKHRMPALFRVRRAYDAMWQEENKKLPVEITSAIELDKKVVDGIAAKIAEQTGRDVQLTTTVDPDVLGGLVVRVGNTVLDASVQRRLERLRKELARA